MASLVEMLGGQGGGQPSLGGGGGFNLFAKPKGPEQDPRITMAGDPDYSIGRAGSQDAFPGAAAQSRVLENQDRAGRLAELMTSIGVGVPEEVQQLQKEGAPAHPSEDNLFFKALGALDAPRRVVNFAIQDVIGGVEEEKGFDSPTAKDYWNALMGKDLEVSLATGHNPTSGSETLALLGWAEEDSLGGKIGRGTVDFAFQVLTDPLTYLTGGASALGKRVLAQTGDTVTSKVIRESIDEGMDAASDLHRRIATNFKETKDTLIDDLLNEQKLEDGVEDFMERAFNGDMDAMELLDDITAQADERARELVRKQMNDEVVTPLLNRQFADEALEPWREYLPAYAQGGLRFSVPFMGTKSLQYGFTIPGTRGLGRKLVGDKVRDVVKVAKKNPRFNSVVEHLNSFAVRFDRNAALHKAVARGELTGGEYVLIQDAISNKLVDFQLAELTATLNNQRGDLDDLFIKSGLLEEAEDAGAEINRALYKMMTTDSDELVVAGKSTAGDSRYADLNAKAKEFKTQQRKVLDRYHKALQEVAPDLDVGMIKNYLPQTMTPKNRKFLEQLANSEAVVAQLDSMASKEGKAGAFYLGQILNAVGAGGSATGNIGSSARLSSRGIGRTIQLGDHSNVVLFDPNVLGTETARELFGEIIGDLDPHGYIDTVTLNNWMQPVLEEVAEKAGIPIPKEGRRMFNEDPFQVINDYVRDIDDTLRQRNLINVMERNGLIIKQPKVVDMQGSLARMGDRLQDPKVMARLDQIDEVAKSRAARIGLDDLAGDTRRFDDEIAALEQERKGLARLLAKTDKNGNVVGYTEEYVTESGGSGRRIVDENMADPEKLTQAKRNSDRYEQIGKEIEQTKRARADANKVTPAEGKVGDTFLDSVKDGTAKPKGDRVRASLLQTDERTNQINRVFVDADEFNVPEKVAKYRTEEFVQLQSDAALSGESIRAIYDPVTGTWHLDEDDALFALAGELDEWNSVQEAVTNGRMAEVWVDPDGTTQSIFKFGRENTLFYQEEVLKFAKANKLREVKFTSSDGGSRGFNSIVDDVLVPLSDQAAHHHSMTQIGGVVRYTDIGDEIGHAQSVYKTVADARRSKLANKPSRTTYAANDRYMVEKFGIRPDDNVENIARGVMIKGENGEWKFYPGFSDPDEINHTPAIKRAMDDATGIKNAPENTDAWYYENMIPNGRAAHIDIVDGKLNVTFQQIDMSAKDYQEMIDRYMPWLARRLDLDDEVVIRRGLGPEGRQVAPTFENVGGTVRKNISDFVDPAKIPDHVLYKQAMEELHEFARIKDLRKELRKPDSALRLQLDEYIKLYGEEFVTSTLNWTKDIMDYERLAVTFVNDLNRLFSYGLDKSGNIKRSTQFGIEGDAAEGLERWVAQMKKNAKKLGINPNTFELEYTSLRNKVDDAGRVMVNPALFNVGGGALQNKLVEKNLNLWMEQLVQNMGSIYTPMGMAQLKASSNYVTRMWKTMTTITRPTFHIRNLMGGVWNNQIIGVGMQDYARVRGGMKDVRKALAAGKTLDDALKTVKNPQTRDMFRAAWDSGILDLSFSSAEFRGLDSAARTNIAKAVGLVNPLNPEDFALARIGSEFMENIEDFLRVSAFSAWYDPNNPASAKVAKEMSLAVHFDYQNLTEFETAIKRFIPFFVWQRRNLPLQVQTMVEQPGIINRYQHLMNAYDEQFQDTEQDDLPVSQYMSGMAIGTDIVLNKDTPWWTRIMIDPDIPVKDLYEVMQGDDPFSMLGNGAEYLASSLGPTYSFAMDFLEQKEYGDVNAPAPMNAVLAQLARTGLYDKTVDGDVQIPYWARTLYNMVAPWSSEMENLGVMPGGQNDPEKRVDLGLTPDEEQFEPMNALQGILMTLGKGVGVQAQTPRDTAAPAYKGSEQLNDIINTLFKEHPGFEEIWEEDLKNRSSSKKSSGGVGSGFNLGIGG